MAQESIVIVITENGSRVVRRNLEDLGGSAEAASRSVEMLKEALAAIGIGLAIREMQEAIDTFVNIENRLRAVGNAGDDLAVVYRRLQGIAGETHQSMETTANLYGRVEQSMRALGHSTEEALQFTETLAAAAKLSGASAQELKYGIQDLAHGLSGGALNGRELNGILREMPSVAALITKGLGMTGVTGNLRELAKEGKLSAEALIKAFAAVRPEIMAALAARTVNVRDAIQDVKNAFMTWIGQTAEAGNRIGALTGLLQALAANMNTAMGIVTGLAAGFLFFNGLPLIIGGVTRAIVALTVAMWSNPMLALASVLVGSITALVMFRDEIILVEGHTATLGDLWRAAMEKIGPAITAAKNALAAFFTWFKGAEAESFSGLDAVHFFTKSVDIMVAAGDFLGKSLRVVFDNFGGVVGSTMASVVNVFIDAINFMVEKFVNIVNGLYEFAVRSGRSIGAALSAEADPVGAGNRMAEAFSSTVDKALSAPKIQRLDDTNLLPSMRQAAEQGKNVGQAFVQNMRDALSGQGGATRAVDGLLPRAEEIGRDRLERERLARAHGESMLNEHGPNTVEPPPGKKGKADHTQNELDTLLSKWDAVDKAIIEVRKAEETLGKGIAKGLITPERAAEVLKQIRDSISDKFLEKYNQTAKAAHELATEERNLAGALKAGFINQEQYNNALAVARLRAQELIDPLGKMNKEYERQIATLQLSTRAQEIENQVHKNKEALLAKGIIMTAQQEAQQRQLLTRLQDTKTQYDYQNEILNKIIEPQRKLQLGQQALNQLFADGKITVEQYNKELSTLRADALASSTDLMDGFSRAFDKLTAQANDFASTAESSVNSVKSAFESAFKDMLKTGKFNVTALLSAVEDACSKMIMQFIMVKLQSAIMGGAGGGAGGAGGIMGLFSSLVGGGSAAASAGAESVFDAAGTLAFANGGQFTVGGSGGTDSQMVAFRASPNEQVTVRTPDQQDNQAPQALPQPVSVKIVNSIDPQETLQHLSTSAGERVILNAIQRNSRAVKALIGTG